MLSWLFSGKVMPGFSSGGISATGAGGSTGKDAGGAGGPPAGGFGLISNGFGSTFISTFTSGFSVLEFRLAFPRDHVFSSNSPAPF